MKILIYVLVIILMVTGLFLGAKQLKAAQDEVTTKDLAAQLKQVLQNQESIMARLDGVKEELKIIKVRSTLR